MYRSNSAPKSKELSPTEKYSMSCPNPLQKFPCKSETVSNMFLKSDVMTSVSIRNRKERSKHWLNPSRVNPDFGIEVFE